MHPEECFFWATHGGTELDLLVVRGQQRIGVEVKRTTAPTTTRSLTAAMQSLSLTKTLVIHAGEHSFPLAHGARAVSFDQLASELEPLE